jgi:hypothetical protein
MLLEEIQQLVGLRTLRVDPIAGVSLDSQRRVQLCWGSRGAFSCIFAAHLGMTLFRPIIDDRDRVESSERCMNWLTRRGGLSANLGHSADAGGLLWTAELECPAVLGSWRFHEIPVFQCGGGQIHDVDGRVDRGAYH